MSFITSLIHSFNHARLSRWPEPSAIMNPVRDWKIFLGVCFVLMLVVALFNGYLFFKINSGEIFQAAPRQVKPIETLDRALLEEVLEYMRNQATLFNHYLQHKPNLIDPSL
jgi:hypothetical protein